MPLLRPKYPPARPHSPGPFLVLVAGLLAVPCAADGQALADPGSGFIRSSDGSTFVQVPVGKVRWGWRCRSDTRDLLLWIGPRAFPGVDVSPTEPFAATFEFQMHGTRDHFSWSPVSDPPVLGENWEGGAWFGLAGERADAFLEALLPGTSGRGRGFTRVMIDLGAGPAPTDYLGSILHADPAFRWLACTDSGAKGSSDFGVLKGARTPTS